MTVVIAVVACTVLLVVVVVSLVLVVVIRVLCRRRGKKNTYEDVEANKSATLTTSGNTEHTTVHRLLRANESGCGSHPL